MPVSIRLWQFRGVKFRQEDSFAVVPALPWKGEMVAAVGVFDGVSSSTAGHYASFLAAVGFQRALIETLSDKNKHLTLTDLARLAVIRANETVLRLRKCLNEPEERSPAAVGTVALLAESGELVVASAGDSRALIRRNGKLSPITSIHNESFDSEIPSPDPWATAVTRYFGQEEGFEAEILGGSLERDPSESLWLMTDGAYEVLLRSASTAAPEAFFDQAEDSMFSDNATVLSVTLLPLSRRDPGIPPKIPVGIVAQAAGGLVDVKG